MLRSADGMQALIMVSSSKSSEKTVMQEPGVVQTVRPFLPVEGHSHTSTLLWPGTMNELPDVGLEPLKHNHLFPLHHEGAVGF